MAFAEAGAFGTLMGGFFNIFIQNLCYSLSAHYTKVGKFERSRNVKQRRKISEHLEEP
jgi:hypothetical protein